VPGELPQAQHQAPAVTETPPPPPPQPFFKTWAFWSGLILVGIIGFLSYSYEGVKDQFPWLVTAQLWTYGRMAHLQARPSRPKWVIGVEVDNRSFFGPPMNRKGPKDTTSRDFLAQVVRNAVQANAAVIALDINLVEQETNAQSSPEEDKHLWEAIQFASANQVPVVLTFAFDINTMRPLDNVFDQSQAPGCADAVPLDAPRAGFDHAPDDLRKVPLVVDAHTQDGNTELVCRSFALQIVDAYERLLGISPTTMKRLEPTIDEREFAYTTFLPQGAFQHVSALDVFQGSADALALLDHRIVLIGGNRTRWTTDNPNPPISDMLDYRPSPEGPMAGMYFHANYVEGLLDDRIQSAFPQRWAALIDTLLAAAIILSLHKLHGWHRVAVVTLLVVVPIIIAYTAMVSLGFTFDFVLPVLLSFLHPALDRYVEYPHKLFEWLKDRFKKRLTHA
jgi:CHASE2 domain-containing sensor protein